MKMPRSLYLFASTSLLLISVIDGAAQQQPDLKLAKTSLRASARGEHQTEWFTVRYATNARTGRVHAKTNSFIEIGTGLNRRGTNGKWEAASDAFQITASGAEANLAGHRVALAGNINVAGAVQIERDGVRMQGHPLCIAYYDPVDGRSELLAELTDATGWLVSSNEIVFSNCFSGLRASIRYRNSVSGLEQDLLLHEQPGITPADLGFSEKTRLELFSEWLGDTPMPQKETRVLQRESDQAIRQQMVEPDFTDSSLTFGALRISQGKAFNTGEQPARETASFRDAINVAKRFEMIDGRKILIEAVPVRSVQAMLNKLPVSRAAGVLTNAATRTPLGSNAVQLAQAQGSVLPPLGVRADQQRSTRNAQPSTLNPIRPLPAKRLAQSKTDNRIQTASATLNPQPSTLNSQLAFVLDWQVLSASAGTYTLRSDMTYLVTSTFSVDHLKMEGGCVVKFDNNVNAKIVVNNSIEALGNAYRPILFTSRYDTSVGESITPPGSIPVNRLFTGLYLNAWNFTGSGKLTNLCISHAGTGVMIDWGSNWTLQDCQFVNCTYPISVGGTDINLKAFNLLIRGDKAYAPAFDSADGGTLNAQHVTVHGVNALAQGWDTATFLNSLVVDLNYSPGTLGAGSQNLWNVVGSGVFESSGFGNHYLPASSPYRNGVTVGIDAQLLAGLRKKTTFAPLPLATTINTPTALSPRSILDTDSPDAGYHYEVLDYSANNTSLQSTLTVKEGVAIGWRGDYALRGGTVTGTASPTRPNRVVHLAAVQESPVAETLQSGVRIGLEPAHAELQFTHFAMPRMPQESYHVGGWFGDLVRLRSCELYNAGFLHNNGGSLELNNCLLERLTLVADQDSYDVDTDLRNCLLKGVSLFIYQLAPVEVRDCVLWESTNTTSAGSIASSHNGYISCPVLSGSTGQDKTGLASSIFTAGAFGNYYQATTVLQNVGSVNDAALAGLYHYTTSTAAASKEGNSQLDIGIHYVGADAYGQPLDVDYDGLADWREAEVGSQLTLADTDGDGLSDGLEVLVLGTNPLTINAVPTLSSVIFTKCPF